MKIAIDIDGVVVNFEESCLPFFNQRFGKDIGPEDMYTYNWRDVFGITREEEESAFNEFYTLREFEDLSLIDGAYEGLRSLVSIYDVSLVTHRPPHIEKKTRDYFRRKFPDLDLEITYSFNGRKSKICPSQGYHLIVEDHGGCAYDCSRAGMVALLFHYPSNEDQRPNENENLVRVYN